MSRMSVFNSPLLLGFEHFERILDRASKASAEGYPPYNIEQFGENALRITLAVAGFSMDDLTVSLEDNQLVVRGHLEDRTRMDAGGEEAIFLHRGIASRQFQRSFVLAEGIEVTAEHVAAHRDRLLRAVEDMRAVLRDVEERPDLVREPTPIPARPPARSPETSVVQAAAAVTRLHPVAPMGGGVDGDEGDMDAFFADEGS